jgi:hypothetical protein
MLRFVPQNTPLAFQIFVMCLVGLSSGRSVSAQENPFAPAAGSVAAADSPAIPMTEPGIDESLPDGTKLIIRAVRQSDPQTSIELAKALKTMLDISQYDQVRYYLSRLQFSGLDNERRYEIYETLGADFFLELHATDEVQPEGREFSKQILSAATAQATSPERIEGLVATLSDEDISVRSEALRKLRRLGPAAAAEMLHVFADSARQNEFSYLRSALRSMGNDALPPLLGAARQSTLQVQAEAIRALGNFRSAEATDVMMRTYLSPKLPESLRRVALDSLMNSDRLPADPGYVEDRFYQRAQEFLLGRRKLAGSLGQQLTIWHWDEGTQRLIPIVVSPETAARIAAAERASDLYEIRPDSARNRQMYLLTQLEAAKRIAGSDAAVDVDGLMNYFSGTTSSEIQSILIEALKLKLIPAATACCELLGEIGKPELLIGEDSQPTPLIQALLLGDRHLQFAAFQAISKLDPANPYAGSSYMMLLGVYMASSEGRASGLVGHLRPDMATSYAATLQEAGLYGKSATSSRDFFHAATLDPDLEVLLITDTLDNPGYGELIQQLRNDLRTKRMPIGLLVRNLESSVRVQRMIGNDPYFVAMPLSLEPELVASHVRRLRELSDPWVVTDLNRRHHAIVAMKWLNRIGKDRPRYSFYDMGSHQEALAKLLYLPGFADSGADILVNLGTPAAQRELLNFAGRSGLPIEERQKAVEAFTQAIKNGGTLLTKEEILQQYDRYNASRTEPVETQQVLGSILDAIESRVDGEN